MGRMADARRRARQKAAQPEEPPPQAAGVDAADTTDASGAVPPAAPAAPAQEAPEPAAAEPAAAEPEPPVAAEAVPDEAPAFPAEDSHGTRLELPSSGLAEDILKTAAEAALVPASTAAELPVPSTAAAAAAAARAHQFTFFAAPERDVREQVEATEHLVTFAIGAESYGVDVRLVQEIIRVPSVTPVPRAPVFVKGVINLRGRIIPVVDLKTKLGLGQVDEADRRTRILVVRLKGRLLGLLVDGASQVLKVPVSVIEAAPEEVVEIESAYIRGVAKLESRLIILVDLVEILAPELRAAGAAP